MPSPFPGMDPYIEACGLWAGFHDDLIAEIKRAVAGVVSDRYVVRTGQRSFIVLVGSEGKDEHLFLPDVRIHSRQPDPRPSREGSSQAVAEAPSSVSPITMRPFIEEEFRESFVEVLDTENENRLVTCLEVLSPSNKVRSSPGRDLYLQKRQGLLLGEANLVEIDLLRGGQRMPMLDPWPSSPYTLLVSRVRRIPRCLVWPATFREPMPPIRVPLLKPDPDISLDLQPMIEAIYSRSRYDTSIDYNRPLDPPLEAEQAAWVEARLLEVRSAASRATGKRRRRKS